MKVNLPISIGSIFFFVANPCLTCRDGFENCEYECDKWKEYNTHIGTVDKIVILEDNTICFADEKTYGNELFTFESGREYEHLAFKSLGDAEKYKMKLINGELDNGEKDELC